PEIRARESGGCAPNRTCAHPRREQAGCHLNANRHACSMHGSTMDKADQPNLPPISFSAKAKRTQEAPISALIAAAVADPNLISFAAGLVDPLTLPVDECAAITQKIFADRSRAQTALQYDTTLGLKALRHQLLAHLEKLEGKSAS